MDEITMDRSTNDWRSDCKDMVSLLSKARQEGRFFDVQFELGSNKTKQVFPVHKAILACRSPVFESMFFGPMAEKNDIIKTNDDPEAFDTLLNYFYGSRNTISSLLSVWKFYLIGDKYLVPEILDVAKEYLNLITITENEFWEVVESDVFTHPLFFDKLLFYLNENTDKIINSEKFLSVPETFLDTLVQLEKLNINESDLLLAVTEWGYRNLKTANLENMLKFYKHIRFCCLTCDEYFRFIERFPEIMDSTTSFKILQYLHCSFGRSLPVWCTYNQKSRKRAYGNDHEQQSGSTPHGLFHQNTSGMDIEKV